MGEPYKHCGSWMIETLNLLIMDKSLSGENDVYIMVRGVDRCDKKGVIDSSNSDYFYNNHTCPWNYLRIPIMVNGDSDHHGVFRWVASIPLPDDYDDDGDFTELFPNVFPMVKEGVG